MKFLSTIFLALIISVPLPQLAAAGANRNLVISYSGSNHGETDPCG